MRMKGGAGLPAGLPVSNNKGGDIGWRVQFAACMALKDSLSRDPWSASLGFWRGPLMDG